MKDKMVSGPIVGIAGTITQNLFALTAKALNLTDRGFLDYAQAVVTFIQYQGITARITAFFGHLAMNIILGIIFVNAVGTTFNKAFYFKVLVFGLISWFIIQAIGTLIRLPIFFKVPPYAALSTLAGALIYSITAGYTLKKLYLKYPS